MTEKQLLFVNMASVIVFGVFLFLSFVTAEAESTHDTMVLISEIIGGVTLIGAIISLFYIKSEQKYVSIAIISFLSPWLLFTIGYEAGVNTQTNHIWIGFIAVYIILVASFILLRKSYKRIQGAFKLIPAFLMFINAIFFVFLLFVQIWWLLPFSE